MRHVGRLFQVKALALAAVDDEQHGTRLRVLEIGAQVSVVIVLGRVQTRDLDDALFAEQGIGLRRRDEGGKLRAFELFAAERGEVEDGLAQVPLFEHLLAAFLKVFLFAVEQINGRRALFEALFEQYELHALTRLCLR